MNEYFAVIDSSDRRGPFPSLDNAISLLKQVSIARNHTDAEAHEFFLRGSSIENVDLEKGSAPVRVNWLPQEKSGSHNSSASDVTVMPSPNELLREHENDVADAHFTTAARKDAETNEGGPADPLPS